MGWGYNSILAQCLRRTHCTVHCNEAENIHMIWLCEWRLQERQSSNEADPNAKAHPPFYSTAAGVRHATTAL